MVDEAQPRISRLAVGILGLFVVGTPMLAYLWATLNRLLSGYIEPVRLLIAVPVTVLFVLLLRLLARFVGVSETERQAAIPPSSERRP